MEIYTYKRVSFVICKFELYFKFEIGHGHNIQ